MAKGGEYEREICKLLSKWWTFGDRDDVFWRTSNSGGRATVRKQQGKDTFGQTGDVQATDPIGQPLIDLCNIELKRGYSADNFQVLIDKPNKAALQTYEQFISQAKNDAIKGHSKHWMLIIKRNRKKSLVYIPTLFFKELKLIQPALKTICPLFFLRFQAHDKKVISVYGSTLDQFLSKISPIDIKRIPII